MPDRPVPPTPMWLETGSQCELSKVVRGSPLKSTALASTASCSPTATTGSSGEMLTALTWGTRVRESWVVPKSTATLLTLSPFKAKPVGAVRVTV